VREIEWLTDDAAVCGVCGKALAPHRAGGVCADCRSGGRVFDRGLSCCTYTGRARDLVRTMKYGDAAWIADGVAKIMHERLVHAGLAPEPAPDPVAAAPAPAPGPVASPPAPADIIVPVPMTPAKRARRGYDQASLVAERLAHLTGMAFAGDILVRTRETAIMSTLGAAERRANLAGAFRLSAYAQRLAIDGDLRLGGVLLVDDVFTTGSTADACAAVLKEAGAGTVTLFTFASGADRDVHEEPEDEAEGADAGDMTGGNRV
jgi:ComF family protein